MRFVIVQSCVPEINFYLLPARPNCSQSVVKISQQAKMIAEAQESLISDLEEAVKAGSPEKHIQTLRHVTDLFLNDADKFSEDQIAVFDDVLCLLINRIETKAKAELGERLAPIDNAPVDVIQKLARDNEILKSL